MATQTAERSFIDPARLYTIKGFEVASGVNATRRWHAKQQGIELKTLRVGKRAFVRGADGIEYIERLAAATD
ncbi:hypothetical protein KOR34_45420 [Posidoniimonas corsicana]|uniref:Helix-turn-helix domain protein n=1 Tax=Posidoniimonas corsicana TaxID=1938618 RepID=A0A5C5UXT7_9BACT|nr:hypothetical protein [Posidoniimonas corsicana]TWT31166.1 hypothetical protein KOR34_45420 [Posidoniimonas corsicana]